MSRTKGLNSDQRHERDEYITPAWCVERFLEKYQLSDDAQFVLDPCASRGELLRTVKRLLPHIWVAGVEINPDCMPDLEKEIGRASCRERV